MDKPTDWRSGTRRIFSNEFKLWLRLWQREGRISRRMPPTIVGPTVSQSFPASPTLVPVELIDTPRCATDGKRQRSTVLTLIYW